MSSYMEMRIWCQRQCGRLIITTLIAVYAVIAAGAVVRSAGAGMGCPDWPQCYGQWIPPTDVNTLPADYGKQYHTARKAKNLRWAAMLETISLTAAAETLRKEASIFRNEPFNLAKAWIEYINRLLGLLSGLCALGFFVLASLGYIATPHYSIFWLSIAAGGSLLVAALLGALVVITHLFPFVVTLHMAVAFLIIAFLLAAHKRQRTRTKSMYLPIPPGIRAWIWALFLLFLLQVLLGTQVREYVDDLLSQQLPRGSVLDAIGAVFYIHRSGSVLLSIGQFALCYWLWRNTAALRLQRLVQAVAAIYCLQILLGAAMYYLAIPAPLQPLHMWLAFVAYGLQVVLLIDTQSQTKISAI